MSKSITTISVKPETKKRLHEKRELHETWDDTINRLLDEMEEDEKKGYLSQVLYRRT